MSVLLTDKVLQICQNSGFGRGVPNGKVDRCCSEPWRYYLHECIKSTKDIVS